MCVACVLLAIVTLKLTTQKTLVFYYKLTTSLPQAYYKFTTSILHTTYYHLLQTHLLHVLSSIYFSRGGFKNFDFTTNFQIDNIPVCLVKHQSIMLMDEMIDDLLGPEDYYLVYELLSGRSLHNALHG